MLPLPPRRSTILVLYLRSWRATLSLARSMAAYMSSADSATRMTGALGVDRDLANRVKRNRGVLLGAQHNFRVHGRAVKDLERTANLLVDVILDSGSDVHPFVPKL